MPSIAYIQDEERKPGEEEEKEKRQSKPGMLRELGKNVLVGKEAVEKKDKNLNCTIGDIKKSLLNQADNKQEGGIVSQSMV